MNALLFNLGNTGDEDSSRLSFSHESDLSESSSNSISEILYNPESFDTKKISNIDIKQIFLLPDNIGKPLEVIQSPEMHPFNALSVSDSEKYSLDNFEKKKKRKKGNVNKKKKKNVRKEKRKDKKRKNKKSQKKIKTKTKKNDVNDKKSKKGNSCSPSKKSMKKKKKKNVKNKKALPLKSIAGVIINEDDGNIADDDSIDEQCEFLENERSKSSVASSVSCSSAFTASNSIQRKTPRFKESFSTVNHSIVKYDKSRGKIVRRASNAVQPRLKQSGKRLIKRSSSEDTTRTPVPTDFVTLTIGRRRK